MRLSNIEAYKRTFNDFFSRPKEGGVYDTLCDKEAKMLWEKYSLGKQGIGIYDVGQWLATFSHMKVTPQGKMLVYDPKEMLDDFKSMSGITADDVKETEV